MAILNTAHLAGLAAGVIIGFRWFNESAEIGKKLVPSIDRNKKSGQMSRFFKSLYPLLLMISVGKQQIRNQGFIRLWK